MIEVVKPYGLKREDITDAGTKSTPVSDDKILLVDSEDNNEFKTVSPDDLGGGPDNVIDVSGGALVHAGDGTIPGALHAASVSNGTTDQTTVGNATGGVRVNGAIEATTGVHFFGGSGGTVKMLDTTPSGGLTLRVANQKIRIASNHYIGSNSHPSDANSGAVDSIIRRAGVAHWGFFAGDNATPAAITAGAATFDGAINLAPITKAALLATTPTATAGHFRITDQNNEPAYPDGTAWRSLATNTVIS